MFQSGKGDCLLLETKDGHHRMLIDGGVRDVIPRPRRPGDGCPARRTRSTSTSSASHTSIEDHIAGVLQMFDDEAAWRVHHHQLQHANLTHTAPSSPRPAEIDSVFHNSFHDQIGKNCGAVEDNARSHRRDVVRCRPPVAHSGCRRTPRTRVQHPAGPESLTTDQPRPAKRAAQPTVRRCAHARQETSRPSSSWAPSRSK